MKNFSPLHYCAFYGHSEISERLCNAGADAFATTSDNKTCFFYAFKNYDRDTILSLLQYAEPNTNMHQYLQKLAIETGLTKQPFISSRSFSEIGSMKVLVNDLRELYNNSDYYDVSFTTDDADGKIIKAHKAIVSVRCPYLLEIMDQGNDSVKVEGIPYSSLNLIFEWIYTSSFNMDEIELPTAVILYHKAGEFKLPNLQNFLASIIGLNTNIHTIEAIFDAAGRINNEELLLKVCQFVLNNISEMDKEYFTSERTLQIIENATLPKPIKIASSKLPFIVKESAIPKPILKDGLKVQLPKVVRSPAVIGRATRDNPKYMKGTTLSSCKAIIQDLMNLPIAVPFNEPVDHVLLNIPNYPLIIKNPMDLGTISTNLNKSPCPYKTLADFSAQVRLVFANSMLFNLDESPIWTDAKELLRSFEVKYSALKKKCKIPETYDQAGTEPVVKPRYQQPTPIPSAQQTTPPASTSVKRKSSKREKRKSSKRDKKRKRKKLTQTDKETLVSDVTTLLQKDYALYTEKILAIIGKDKAASGGSIEIPLETLSKSVQRNLKDFVDKEFGREPKSKRRKRSSKNK
eukprot:TRINITY_DN4706_c0_g1_i3.p1 TRINITY_DN4706_c0_g1~~TRINITY_DN4706_c0_g1_i3.p1  ORF type:complete len:675 (+),score=127.27 TRINITY_DN4706_c0_g1_i3:305-2026(+)